MTPSKNYNMLIIMVG